MVGKVNASLPKRRPPPRSAPPQDGDRLVQAARPGRETRVKAETKGPGPPRYISAAKLRSLLANLSPTPLPQALRASSSSFSAFAPGVGQPASPGVPFLQPPSPKSVPEPALCSRAKTTFPPWAAEESGKERGETRWEAPGSVSSLAGLGPGRGVCCVWGEVGGRS